ncbi:MAG: OB-fold nucleic acid binding domain-containing protein [Austwickia sp.]|jgi:RecG-like helicase|nr:MAG: OB-fold nucleic acid binding domain-containing protein [Austwickia sp.]
MAGFLARLTHRVANAAQEADAAALTEHAVSVGATRIRDVVDRGLADVSGELRTLTLPPRGKVPALIAELYDGTGTITLVWLGRREIRGVQTGTRMKVRGRVTYRKGTPTIFNPQYELMPRTHGA